MKTMKFKIPKGLKNVNWINMCSLILFAMIFSIIAIKFPETICSLNYKHINCFYGKFASNLILMLLFWILSWNFKIIKEKQTRK